MNTPTNLADIRKQIDALDGELRGLLLARAGLVAQVGKAKAVSGDTSTLRPKREAAQISTLAEWQKTQAPDLPLDSLVAIWREIIGMAVVQQGGLSVYSLSSTQAIARAHFGASMDYQLAATPAQAMAAIDTRSVAIIPLDQASLPSSPQQVVARLPATGPAQALCYGLCGEEAGEGDVTLVQAELGVVANPAGGAVDGVEIFADASKRLYEMDGAMSAADIEAQFGAQLIWLGTYRRPFCEGAE